jgi:polysaccharide pyruvyl transferase WcaK-like protein
MKKIGILTYHDINNFGAQLQAHALLTFLRTSGFQAEVINYQPPRTRIRIIAAVIRPIMKFRIKLAIDLLKQRLIFRHSAREFDLTKLPAVFTSRQVASQARQFDALICGSDEIWNFTNYLGYLPAYVLDIDFPKAKISYAASIGDCRRTPELDQLFYRTLSKFTHLLVRDAHTRQMIESLGLHAQEVLDPTFLIEQSIIPAKKPPYIMVSGALTDTQISTILRLAKKTRLPILSPGYRYAGIENSFMNVSPSEWVSLIYGSTFHITSLFHGAIFSMKGAVPFAAFLTPGKEGKIGHLMHSLGMESRLIPVDVTEENLLEVLLTKYPYDFAERKSKLVRQSQQCLLKALETV